MIASSQDFQRSVTNRRLAQRFRALRTLLRAEHGQDNVEYALLASWISIVAFFALQAIGPHLGGLYVAIRFALTGIRSALP